MDKEKLDKADALVEQGKRRDAAALADEVYGSTPDLLLKVRAIMILTNTLNRAEHLPRLVKLCNEALSVLRADTDIAVDLMTKKAMFLSTQVAMLEAVLSSTILSPRWIGFATETEKTEYERISAQVDAKEHEIVQTINTAIENSGRLSNKLLMAGLFHAIGDIQGTRHSQMHIRFLRGNPKTSSNGRWIYESLLIKLGLQDYIFFTKEQRRMLRECVQQSVANFERAGKLYIEAGREVNAGYSLYSAALHLRTFGQPRRAKKYLARAKPIAVKNDEEPLIKRIAELEHSIAVKGKDIPDYMNGEVRDLDD